MKRWENATKIVKTSREITGDCADIIVPVSGTHLTGSPWYQLELAKNNSTSEVRVIKGYDWPVLVGQMSTDIFLGCLFTSPACVTSFPGYADPQRHAAKAIPSADISFNQSVLEEDMDRFSVPLYTKFNTCHPKTNANGDIDYSLYETVLHEVGHALGLSNAGEIKKYISGYSGEEIYEISHPTIADSVLNYDRRVRDQLHRITAGFSELNCSPYPLDIMAIHALYQTLK